MKIKILVKMLDPVTGNKDWLPGFEVDLDEAAAAKLINEGKAEEVIAVKAKANAAEVLEPKKPAAKQAEQPK